MRRWIRLGSRPVIDDRWLRVTADSCEIEPGKVIEPFYVVHENEWVHVYAINSLHEVLTVRQYRYAADAICTELPVGVVDADEAPESAAKRELLEETGHVAERWSYVGKLFANPARQSNSECAARRRTPGKRRAMTALATNPRFAAHARPSLSDPPTGALKA